MSKVKCCNTCRHVFDTKCFGRKYQSCKRLARRDIDYVNGVPIFEPLDAVSKRCKMKYWRAANPTTFEIVWEWAYHIAVAAFFIAVILIIK